MASRSLFGIANGTEYILLNRTKGREKRTCVFTYKRVIADEKLGDRARRYMSWGGIIFRHKRPLQAPESRARDLSDHSQ